MGCTFPDWFTIAEDLDLESADVESCGAILWGKYPIYPLCVTNVDADPPGSAPPQDNVGKQSNNSEVALDGVASERLKREHERLNRENAELTLKNKELEGQVKRLMTRIGVGNSSSVPRKLRSHSETDIRETMNHFADLIRGIPQNSMTACKRVVLDRSGVEGWGVFVKDGFMKGDKILRYEGETINRDEADEREEIFRKPRHEVLNKVQLINCWLGSLFPTGRRTRRTCPSTLPWTHQHF
jgi:hypothetical protein